MKKYLLLPLLALLLILSGCTAKRLTKRGIKFEEAGMYEMAANFFFQAITINPKNVNAAIGLQKNGQRLLDEKSLMVQKAYFDGDDKQTVYSYIEAQKYFEKVKSKGISLDLSGTAKSYYEEAKPRYIQNLYNEARLLLDEEKFTESEKRFNEIKEIDPSYQGVDEHMRIAMAEPAYREGTRLMSNGLYRTAYNTFNGIVQNHGTYKDSKDLRDEALANALVAISIGKIENHSTNNSIKVLVESEIKNSISNLSTPFITLVDTEHTQHIINEQVRGISLGSNIKVGQMIGANAMFTGKIVKYIQTAGKIQSTERKAYQKSIVTTKNKETGENERTVKYSKVKYESFTGSSNISISFQYQLTSIETGAILVTDAININHGHSVNYATFSGNYKNLVPGNWEHASKSSPRDRIDDTPFAVERLQEQFTAPKQLKSILQLQDEVMKDIGKRVATKIEMYNPEG